jgi:hypothetical protein
MATADALLPTNRAETAEAEAARHAGTIARREVIPGAEAAVHAAAEVVVDRVAVAATPAGTGN